MMYETFSTLQTKEIEKNSIYMTTHIYGKILPDLGDATGERRVIYSDHEVYNFNDIFVCTNNGTNIL